MNLSALISAFILSCPAVQADGIVSKHSRMPESEGWEMPGSKDHYLRAGEGKALPHCGCFRGIGEEHERLRDFFPQPDRPIGVVPAENNRQPSGKRKPPSYRDMQFFILQNDR